MWREGVTCTVSMFPGWVIMDFHCPNCGAKWVGVSVVGTEGVTCPECGFDEPAFVWRDVENPPDMPHDGCWLWGDDMPSEFDGCDEDEVVTVGEPVKVLHQRAPWFMRILFFLVGLWVVKHRQELGDA